MFLFNEKYQIVTDPLNVTLKKNTGRKIEKDSEMVTVYDTLAYCTTYEQAFKFLLNDILKDTLSDKNIKNADGIKEVIDTINAAKDEISNEIHKLGLDNDR